MLPDNVSVIHRFYHCSYSWIIKYDYNLICKLVDSVTDQINRHEAAFENKSEAWQLDPDRGGKVQDKIDAKSEILEVAKELKIMIEDCDRDHNEKSKINHKTPDQMKTKFQAIVYKAKGKQHHVSSAFFTEKEAETEAVKLRKKYPSFTVSVKPTNQNG